MKRAKRRFARPAASRPVFFVFFHSHITADELLAPCNAVATDKLIDGELVRFTEMRFIESPPMEAQKGGRNG